MQFQNSHSHFELEPHLSNLVCADFISCSLLAYQVNVSFISWLKTLSPVDFNVYLWFWKRLKKKDTAIHIHILHTVWSVTLTAAHCKQLQHVEKA